MLHVLILLTIIAAYDLGLWITGHRTISQRCWAASRRHPTQVSLFAGLAIGFVLGHLFW